MSNKITAFKVLAFPIIVSIVVMLLMLVNSLPAYFKQAHIMIMIFFVILLGICALVSGFRI